MIDAQHALRKEIIVTCISMDNENINQGTSGNISARWEDGFLITPSGLPYKTMLPEDIIFMDMDGGATGPHNPSSEWRFHLDILKSRSDITAVIHAHPIYCTAFSMVNQHIPAVHYMIAAVGGPTIRCAPYATFGTKELSANAVTALKNRMGCLLGNHGMIACGTSLAKAFWLACEIETLAHQYAVAMQLGEPQILSADEIVRVVEKFKSYGPNSTAAYKNNSLQK